MAGNIFGQVFRVTTFGESHGAGIGCVIDGVPPLLDLTDEDVQKELDRRKPGQSDVTSPRKEADKVEILSGVFEGKTTGTPLALFIRNADQRSSDYDHLKDIFRPGHADYTYAQKYGIRDYRGGGRSSGRETAARVAAGAVAKKIIAGAGIRVTGYTLAVGGIYGETVDLDVIEKNIVRAADLEKSAEMIALIARAREQGDSVGGIVELVIKGCPAGIGDPVFDKLEARLAQALLSIGSVRGVEFGAGFMSAAMKGSDNNDEVIMDQGRPRTRHNHSGGITGGISTGEEIVLRIAVKPTSSISRKQKAATASGGLSDIEIQGRHDPCLTPRIVPVAEAMTALVLADAFLLQKTIR
jgi:chorismate synthase